MHTILWATIDETNVNFVQKPNQTWKKYERSKIHMGLHALKWVVAPGED